LLTIGIDEQDLSQTAYDKNKFIGFYNIARPESDRIRKQDTLGV
jgi:hypothetical protein